MAFPQQISLFLFILSIAAIAAVLGYPLIVLLLSPFSRQTARAVAGAALPAVTLVVVTRNSAEVIEEKVRNCLSLDYPGERLQIIVYSDGSTDDTLEKLGKYRREGIQVYGTAHHAGKIPAINEAVSHATGEILALTDTAAILEADAILKLVDCFADDSIGGVCGHMSYAKGGAGMERGQAAYLAFDRTIKTLESRTGSVTSNNGAFYGIRRSLFHPIPPAVTDDLYVLLSVVRQGFRFTFSPEIRLSLPSRSKSASHELERRRRIVSTSLRGIWLSREVLNPAHYGFFALALATNKIVRRLLPFFLVILFFSSAWLSFSVPWAGYLVLLQIAFYGGSALYPLYKAFLKGTLLGRAGAVGHYFLLGNCGTFLGVLDFLGGRAPAKWDPA